MSGGPAVVDSLAEFEKRFGWPTEPPPPFICWMD